MGQEDNKQTSNDNVNEPIIPNIDTSTYLEKSENNNDDKQKRQQ